jgi:hypothetical protein
MYMVSRFEGFKCVTMAEVRSSTKTNAGPGAGGEEAGDGVGVMWYQCCVYELGRVHVVSAVIVPQKRAAVVHGCAWV